MSFVIYPAIDIVNGKCVRLHQGDYDLEKIYSEDPVSQALQFVSEGAEWIHVVDLDAARTGNPENREIISRIADVPPRRSTTTCWHLSMYHFQNGMRFNSPFIT